MTTLSFWGGVGTVTGSKYLIQTSQSRILVDCGLFQGLKELRERNWQEPPFSPGSLDAVVLTHAHIDHSGYLPRLVRQGFHKPVYCSRGTAELLKIMLPDSARLQEEEADYRNRHGLTHHRPARPLYTERDAHEALKLLHPIGKGIASFDVAPEICVSLRDAGHILGSRFALIRTAGAQNAGRILFSGDLGRYGRPILPDISPPPPCDYLLVEATYGDRLHGTESPKDSLARIITAAAPRGRTILIPAFAVGRIQEVLYLLRELEDEGRIPVLPVCVDSPMAEAATRVTNEMIEDQDDDFRHLVAEHRYPLRTRSMETATTRAESKRLNTRQGARIVLSAAGMMTGGRVLHHAERVLPDPDATLVLVGFQAAGTTGRRIQDGEPSVKIRKQWIPVRCHVERIDGLSAHADWQDVLRWLEGMPSAPRTVFITHGEPDAAEAMRQHIIERFGWRVEIPQYGEQVEIE